ncbi:MAG: coproporphyrinogen III oxidase, partial [Pedobacter sp.]
FPLNDEQSAAQFTILTEKLGKADFDHYEISNFARPGKYAVHNTNYWKGVPYLGIGPSAHGFNGNVRYLNVANNAIYLNNAREGKSSETIEELSTYDRFNEYLMTSLRTMWGTDLKKIELDFDKYFLKDTLKNSEQFIERQWLINENETLKLTAEGKLFADYIASELFLSEEDHR